MNRQNNAELERRGPVPQEELNDVSLSEEWQKRARKIVDNAYKIAAAVSEGFDAIEELEEFGGYEWGHAGHKTSLQDVRKTLQDIRYKLWSIQGLMPPSPAPRRNRRGNPGALWHGAGRQFGKLFQVAMRDAGYAGPLALTSEGSVTAIVGAKAMGWAYNRTIQPKGFASAMTKRNREQEITRDFDERFRKNRASEIGAAD